MLLPLTLLPFLITTMAISEVSICNMALRHIGISEVIAALTEKSKEAAACVAFYETTRDEVLRDFPWPFATKIVALAKVADIPTVEWAYSYRVPTDKIYFRRVLNGASRFESPSTRVPFRITADDTGGLLYTDLVDAVGEYTFRVIDPTMFPADFAQAVSLRLAGALAPAVAGGDQFKLGDRALKLYDTQVRKAWRNSANEGQKDVELDSEFITVRE